MDNLGIITLLPPIIIIVFALLTRRTFEALVLGGIVGAIIGYGKDFFWTYLDYTQTTIGENTWTILVVGIFGSFIAIMRKANATSGFTKLVSTLIVRLFAADGNRFMFRQQANRPGGSFSPLGGRTAVHGPVLFSCAKAFSPPEA